MKTTTVNVAELVHPERNVRKHPENQINEMARSIEMFGQIRPVVIDENNEILAGNGLVLALKKLGRETANVLKMTNLSENDKKKLMIADNRIYSLGFDDSKTVMDLISEMKDFEIPGYNADLLEELLADVEGVDEQIESFGILTPEETADMTKAAEATQKAIVLAEREAAPEPRETHFTPAPTPPTHATEVERTIKCPHCGETIWL